MSRPYVCVSCCREMRCEENGVIALELIEDGTPYRIFFSDKWKCPVCDHEVLLGHGDPIYSGDKEFGKYNQQVEVTFS